MSVNAALVIRHQNNRLPDKSEKSFWRVVVSTAAATGGIYKKNWKTRWDRTPARFDPRLLLDGWGVDADRIVMQITMSEV